MMPSFTAARSTRKSPSITLAALAHPGAALLKESRMYVFFQVVGMLTVALIVGAFILHRFGIAVFDAEIDDNGIGFGIGWSDEGE